MRTYKNSHKTKYMYFQNDAVKNSLFDTINLCLNI